jgi:glycosylphosphatidylinositol transamidase (GPIT) subunit GPI8
VRSQERSSPREQRRQLSPPLHTSNYAVIVSSSRYWFNYRHAANALSIYQLLRRYGFSDENIILMIADEYAVNPRNPAKNKMYNTAASDTRTSKGARRNRPSLHTDDIEIDYRGEDVVSSFRSLGWFLLDVLYSMDCVFSDRLSGESFRHVDCG